MTAPATQTTRTARDAAEFGIHVKQGGWRLGLLVARNVVRAPGRVSAEALAPKVNAGMFARMADCSNDRVLRYLNAWERAAASGLVPSSASLNPGDDVELDMAQLPTWTTNPNPGIGIHSVYVHLAADGMVLYVGVSLDVIRRTFAHSKTALWWRHVVTINVETHPNRASALIRESELISVLQPPHNHTQPKSHDDKALALGDGR